MNLREKLEERYGKKKDTDITLKRYVTENLEEIESLMKVGYTVKQIASVLDGELAYKGRGGYRYIHSLLYLARKKRKAEFEAKL